MASPDTPLYIQKRSAPHSPLKLEGERNEVRRNYIGRDPVTDGPDGAGGS